jgi:hypothetical protein
VDAELVADLVRQAVAYRAARDAGST